MFVKRIRWQLKQPFHFWLVHSMPSKQVSNSVRQSVWQKLLRVIVSSFNRDSVSPNGFSVACRWSQMVFIKPQYIHNFSFLKVWNILLVPVKEAIKSLIQRLRRLLNILTADFNNSFIPLFVGIIFDTAKSQTCNRMDAKTATNRSIVANFTGNLSLRPAVQSVPLGPEVSPFDEFFKFAFGSAIYIIIVSFITVFANGLLLVVFFFDPFKIFRTATTYFLIGLAFVDILTAASQEPMYATCFIMMYLRHPDTLATCTPLLNVGQVIAVAAMNASFLIVLAFTITQYIVLASPLKYGRRVTKSRVVICVFAIYAYSILFSLFPVMSLTKEIVQKIDNIFHSITLVYVTIIFYILLYVAFRKKMAASKSLQEHKTKQDRGRENKQTGTQVYHHQFSPNRHLVFDVSAFCRFMDLPLVFQRKSQRSKCSYRQSRVSGQPDLPEIPARPVCLRMANTQISTGAKICHALWQRGTWGDLQWPRHGSG